MDAVVLCLWASEVIAASDALCMRIVSNVLPRSTSLLTHPYLLICGSTRLEAPLTCQLSATKHLLLLLSNDSMQKCSQCHCAARSHKMLFCRLQEASQSGPVGPCSEMHQAAELAAAAQPVSHESNEAASLLDASHIAPTPIPHADHSLPAASQSRLGLQLHPKPSTAHSRRDSSMQTVPVATTQPANDLSAQAPARANTSAATAGKTGSAARNMETANTEAARKLAAAAEARAAVARKAQQAVDELLLSVTQTGQTRKQEAAWAAKRKVVEEQVRKARADMAAKEAADKAQAANCAAQTGTSNAQTASPGSTSVGNPLHPKPTGSSSKQQGTSRACSRPFPCFCPSPYPIHYPQPC